MKLILLLPLFLLILFGAAATLLTLLFGDKKNKAEAEKKESEDLVAYVFCSGGKRAKEKYVYDGIADCRAAVPFAGGYKLCVNACAGLGNCVRACHRGALKMREGLAVVDRALCNGCGACAEACPKDLIRLVPRTSAYLIPCSCGDKGAQVLRFCEAGCIGCKKCEKVCPAEAIDTSLGFARIRTEKCTACGACAEACPRGIIRNPAEANS